MQRRSARTAAKAAAAASAPATTVFTATTTATTTTSKATASRATSSSKRQSKPPTASKAVPKPTPASMAATTPASATTSNIPPDSLPVLPFKNAPSFEAHLSSLPANNTTGLWLKISKKASGIPSITYDQAIDSALCHGWIDGQRRPFSDLYFLQRFTPRRKNSLWSKRNVEKVAVLTAAGRMRPAGQAEIDAAKADGRWERAYAGASTMTVPRDFEVALEKDERAKGMFETLGKTARYSFCWRIETCKKAETRRRKIEQFVEMLAEGKTL